MPSHVLTRSTPLVLCVVPLFNEGDPQIDVSRTRSAPV